MTTTPTESRVDGRNERSRRTRVAIVAAHLALVREGDLKPTAAVIARRAGISVRSFWLHFPDMEAVYEATAEAVFDEVGGFGPPIDTGLPLATRIDIVVERKLVHLDAIDPFARASELREAHSPALRRNHARHISRESERLAETFAPELAGLSPERRQDVLSALTATTAWRCWTTMREHLGLDRERIASVLALTVTAILATAPIATPLPQAPAQPPEGVDRGRTTAA